MHDSLCIIELYVKLGGDHLRQERAPDERAARRFNTVRRKPPGQLHDESPEVARSQKQWIKVEPEVAVMTGLQPEMPLSGCQQADEFLLHKIAAVLP